MKAGTARYLLLSKQIQSPSYWMRRSGRATALVSLGQPKDNLHILLNKNSVRTKSVDRRCVVDKKSVNRRSVNMTSLMIPPTPDTLET
jgi:hypothetical protein